MSPGWIIAAGWWIGFSLWLLYQVYRAPYIEDPLDEFWLGGIESASLAGFDECVEDDFAKDADELSRLRFYERSEWSET